MKTKIFAGLAFAALFAMSGPAFAKDDKGHGGGNKHAVAVAHAAGGHRGGGGHAMAVAHRGGGHGRHVAAAGNPARRTFARTNAVQANAVRNNMTRNNNLAATRNTHRGNGARTSVAFGGNTYNYNVRNNNRGASRGVYAFSSHPGWNHGQEYDWNHHHYRWYNNAWYIIDAGPYDAYYPYNSGYYGYPGYGYSGDDSVTVQVQQELAHDGYYGGPIDGIAGPGTRSAIASYQRDNGLRVTGFINGSLLDSMGLQ